MGRVCGLTFKVETNVELCELVLRQEKVPVKLRFLY